MTTKLERLLLTHAVCDVVLTHNRPDVSHVTAPRRAYPASCLSVSPEAFASMSFRPMMSRVALVLLATLGPSFCAFADEPTPNESDIQALAVHALRWAFYYPNGYRWEYSGVISLHHGELRHSSYPRTLKQVDAVGMDADRMHEPGDTLVALYHSHPCASRTYYSEYFSPNDLISVFFYNVPSFILDECTGDVHEFDPAQDKVRSGKVEWIKRKDGSSRKIYLPAGRIVGNIGDRGPDLSDIEALMGQTLYY
jgi:hypothetical protein